MFQFQTGSIRSLRLIVATGSTCVGFNSKLVRLEARLNAYVMCLLGFNSKLVRLEVRSAPSRCRFTDMFQFQTGSIRSKEDFIKVSEVK